MRTAKAKMYALEEMLQILMKLKLDEDEDEDDTGHWVEPSGGQMFSQLWAWASPLAPTR